MAQAATKARPIQTAAAGVGVVGAVAAAIEAGKPGAEKKAPTTLFVLDSTATPEAPARTHEMIVDGAIREFTFKSRVPLELPRAIALRFVKHDSFKLTNAQGEPIAEFRRQPRQPDELQAGETLTLADDETVARYDELSTPALQHRVLEMPGSEHFDAPAPSRKDMIAFIIAAKLEARAKNTSRVKDVGADEFVPDADFDEHGDE
jgi:hypothetical protein